jgi:hypothetical protein
MTDLQMSSKSFVTVSEMAEMCQLSRSRFYDLIEAGVFPKPGRLPSSKRPICDRKLIEKCLEIRQTGIGLTGQPILFNRKAKRTAQSKPHRKVAQEKRADHRVLLAALMGVGLNTTPQAVADALAKLYTTGQAELNQGDVVRKVFLHLQGKKK